MPANVNNDGSRAGTHPFFFFFTIWYALRLQNATNTNHSSVSQVLENPSCHWKKTASVTIRTIPKRQQKRNEIGLSHTHNHTEVFQKKCEKNAPPHHSVFWFSEGLLNSEVPIQGQHCSREFLVEKNATLEIVSIHKHEGSPKFTETANAPSHYASKHSSAHCCMLSLGGTPSFMGCLVLGAATCWMRSVDSKHAKPRTLAHNFTGVQIFSGNASK